MPFLRIAFSIKLCLSLHHEIGSKNPVSRSIYEATHDRMEKLSLKINNIMIYIFYLFIVAGDSVAIYQYIASGYETEQFKQIHPAT